MKRLKIIIGIMTWFSWVGLSPVQGQAVVHDPVHMGSNVVGFGQELQEALTQTQQFFELLSNTKQQFASLEKIREITDKVSSYVMYAKEVEEVIRMGAYAIKSISDGVKMLSSGELQPYEVNSILKLYSSSLGQINNTIMSVQQLISDGVQLNTNDRLARLEKKNQQMLNTCYLVNRLGFRCQDEIAYRQKLSQRIKNAKRSDIPDLLKAIPFEAQPSNFDGSLNIIGKPSLATLPDRIEFKFDGNSFKPDIRETVSPSEVNKQYTANTTAATKLFYLISAIVAVIGALRVLQIWNQGNDISKAIVSWGGTSLFLMVVGYFIQLFFK